MLVIARSIAKDGQAPFEYLSGGTDGAWLWTLDHTRAMCWNTAIGAHEMLKIIGRPEGATILSVETDK